MESTHPYFPLSQWCKLIEQSNITLNLLRPSIINPKLSAYSQVFGNFDYQKTPLPLPGMKVLSHVLTIDRRSFYPHAIKGFYVGVVMEHYRCFKIFIPSTGRVRIYGTIRWFPCGSLKLPIPSKDELICSVIDDLRATLQFSVKNNILPPEVTTSRKTLLDLNAIINNRDLHDTPTKPSTSTNVPRVKVQSKDTTIVPRVQLHSNDTTRIPRVQTLDATPSPQPTLLQSK